MTPSTRDSRNQRHSQLVFEAGGQKCYRQGEATPPCLEAEKQSFATSQGSSPLVHLGRRDPGSFLYMKYGLLSEPSPAGPHLAPHSLLPICCLSVIVWRTSTFFFPDDFGTLSGFLELSRLHFYHSSSISSSHSQFRKRLQLDDFHITAF